MEAVKGADIKFWPVTAAPSSQRLRKNGHKILRILRGWLTRVRGAVAPRLRDAEFS